MARYLRIILPIFFFLLLGAGVLTFISSRDGAETADATAAQADGAAVEVGSDTAGVEETTRPEETQAPANRPKKFTLPKRRLKDEVRTAENDTDQAGDFELASDQGEVRRDSTTLETSLSELDEREEFGDRPDFENDAKPSMEEFAQVEEEDDYIDGMDLLNMEDTESGDLASVDELQGEQVESQDVALSSQDSDIELSDAGDRDWSRDDIYTNQDFEPGSLDLARTEAMDSEPMREEQENVLDVEERIEETKSALAATEDRRDVREPEERAPSKSSQRFRLPERKIAKRENAVSTTPKVERTETPRVEPTTTMTVSSRSSEQEEISQEPRIQIRNSTKLTVAYILDGKVRRLAPGASFEARWDGRRQLIRFDRGGDLGPNSQELDARSYEFQVSYDGWKLVPRSSR